VRVKYRVNLYPEREERAGSLRRHLLRGALFGVVAGVEVLLIGFLIVSGFQLRERVQSETRAVEEVEAAARPVPEAADVAVARSLVQTRVARVDWSGVLLAVSGALPRNLILTRVEAGAGGLQSGLNGLNLEGRISGGGTDLTPVLGFMQALRESAAVTARFPQVDLGTAPSQTDQTFQVIVRAAESRKEGSQ
jgi:Tfp pilus assembly protein PilN